MARGRDPRSNGRARGANAVEVGRRRADGARQASSGQTAAPRAPRSDENGRARPLMPTTSRTRANGAGRDRRAGAGSQGGTPAPTHHDGRDSFVHGTASRG